MWCYRRRYHEHIPKCLFLLAVFQWIQFLISFTFYPFTVIEWNPNCRNEKVRHTDDEDIADVLWLVWLQFDVTDGQDVIKNEAVVADVVIDGPNPNQIWTDFSVCCYTWKESKYIITDLLRSPAPIPHLSRWVSHTHNLICTPVPAVYSSLVNLGGWSLMSSR